MKINEAIKFLEQYRYEDSELMVWNEIIANWSPAVLGAGEESKNVFVDSNELFVKSCSRNN